MPEWYFWPFYAILRSFTVDFILPAKLWGVLAMFSSILLLFFLPWLDKSPVRSGNYRPVFKPSSGCWSSTCWSSAMSAARRSMPLNVMLSQIATAYYFLHFLVILPLVSAFETPAAAAVLDHRSGARRGRRRRLRWAEASRAGGADGDGRSRGQTAHMRFIHRLLIGAGLRRRSC